MLSSHHAGFTLGGHDDGSAGQTIGLSEQPPGALVNGRNRCISLFRVVPIDSDIAKSGGLYKRDFGKSHGVGLADAILAATADNEKAELKTLNVKHYPMIKGLKPAYEK